MLARYHAVDGWPGDTKVANRLWAYAETHTPGTDVAAYTQAIMDLGATVCMRSRPACEACPLSAACVAYGHGEQTRYPGRKPKKDKPLKQASMLLLRAGDAVYLERRPASGIWGGLWGLPEIENADDLDEWCSEKLGCKPEDVERWDTVRHSFTHFDLDIVPIAVRVTNESRRVADDDNRIWYVPGAAKKLGLAAPVAGLIERLTEDRDSDLN